MLEDLLAILEHRDIEIDRRDDGFLVTLYARSPASGFWSFTAKTLEEGIKRALAEVT